MVVWEKYSIEGVLHMKMKLFEIVSDKDKFDILKACEVLGSKESIRDWAYILHDKDETREHYHLTVRLKDAYDSKYIAEWFGIAENFIGKVKGRWSDMLKYLTHANAPTKHQYEDSLVESNFNWIVARDKPSVKDRQEQIINSIVDGSIREYNYFDFITAVEYDMFSRSIDKAFKYRTDVLKGVSREMNCIFITGDSGTGKTTYAKQIAKDKGYSVFVSSGSNDVLDDYKGQDCVILDDLRPSAIGLSDLLKMLDNHTSSTVKSRYKNKVLECKLMIITTTLDIDTFFKNVFSEESETCVQLKRRCRLWIHMFLDYILLYVWQDKSRRYGNPVKQRNPISSMFISRDMDKDEELDFLQSLLGSPVSPCSSDDDLEPVQGNFEFEE